MILKLLSQKNFITFNKAIAKAIGLEEALTLGQICALSNVFNDKEFYFTYAEIQEETCLSEYAVKKAVQNLIKLGILKMTRKGCPCKNWYTIQEDAIKDVLESRNQTSSPHENGGTREGENTGTSPLENEGTFKKDINTKDITTKDIIYIGNSEKSELAKIKKKSEKFEKPSVEEITEYCKLRNNAIDPQHFFDFYESKGWLVGKSRMKDWKACVRTWERNGCNKIQREKPRTEGISAAEYKEGMSDLENTPF